jgi:signal peptidase I
MTDERAAPRDGALPATPPPDAQTDRDLAPLAERPASRRSTGVGCLVELLQTVVLTLAIFFGLQTFVGQPFEVKQLSMQQTLEPGHFVLVDKLTPRWDGYNRGDIVVFTPPDNWQSLDRTPYIKRVIGVPGETVEIRDGGVHVDGELIDEPYLFAIDGDIEPTTTSADPPRWVIPDGQLFVLGDHREQSQDSRTFGPIDVDNVIGRAWLRYWPADAAGILQTPSYEEPASP